MWVHVAQRTESLATVIAPTGDILFPPYKELPIGSTEEFVFKGRNTNANARTLMIIASIRNPNGIMVKQEQADAMIQPNDLIQVKVTHEFIFAGVYTATVDLYVWI